MIRFDNGTAFPAGYEPRMDVRETQIAIKMIKDHLESELADTLNLTRVSAPLFVRPESGLNDDLNGIERPVSFDIPSIGGHVEIVQSLAKWKRMALHEYGFAPGEGLYTDMNAVRRDEVPDNLHSVYVDQWDWELILRPSHRNTRFLRSIVTEIYACLRRVENRLLRVYPYLDRKLPESIHFVTAQELEDRWPDLSPREREDAVCKEKKAVFLMGIGAPLSSGRPHDGRAPDYDDWSLNGDILFWYPVLERAVEVSSMGIRVDDAAMASQLEISGKTDRAARPFHRQVLDGVLPATVGGGIGQSRMCMFYLDKAHIGEVQTSVWPQEMIDSCLTRGISLL
ncbi:MAG: aspartate--ammonia ligase [Clostridiaceae bacterium]|nr:aspartate--ammonia ligase [Clostridiaceae bacterium]